MAQKLRMSVALAKDPILVSNTHIERLTATCNSRVSLLASSGTYTHMVDIIHHIHIYIKRIKIFK